MDMLSTGTMKRLIWVLPLLLMACKKPATEGTIVAKTHEPAQSYTSTTYIKSGNVLVPIVNHYYDDEDWIVTLRGFNGKDTVETEYYLTEAEWDSTSIGNYECYKGCPTESPDSSIGEH